MTLIPRPTMALLAAASLTLLSGCGSGDGATSHPTGMHGSTSSSPSSGSGTGTAGAGATGTPAAGEHNHADEMFATMMIPHHAQAVTMSDIVLAKPGVDPEVRTLASTIKAAQAPEIEQMRGWLTGWQVSTMGTDHGDMGMGGMDGMLSAAELDALRAADGPQASKLYLTGMIEHHEGAITMAKSVLDKGRNPDVEQLAEAIVRSQQAEIQQMKTLLAR